MRPIIDPAISDQVHGKNQDDVVEISAGRLHRLITDVELMMTRLEQAESEVAKCTVAADELRQKVYADAELTLRQYLRHAEANFAEAKFAVETGEAERLNACLMAFPDFSSAILERFAAEHIAPQPMFYAVSIKLLHAAGSHEYRTAIGAGISEDAAIHSVMNTFRDELPDTLIELLSCCEISARARGTALLLADHDPGISGI